MSLRRRAFLAAGAVLILLLGALASTRYGVLIPQVRLLIEARTDGLKLGRLGRLKIEGLSGDIWRDAHARRLTIRDEKGVWLEARNVHLTWNYAQLIQRRFVATLVEAETVRVLHRPTLGPKGKDRALPVSFHIDRGRTRLLLDPAFSYRRGDYDLNFALDVERGGSRSGNLRAASRLHAGDHLTVDIALAKAGDLKLAAVAEEAQGGALAGAIGLPADLPFTLDVRADGAVSSGSFTATAASGGTVPLSAKGAWSKQGGQAGGRVSLTASTLTAPYAARLGRELRFGLAGRKTVEGRFALDARVLSEGLNAHAWGPGDLGKRTLSPQGVRVEAETPSLDRFVAGPKLGQAQIAGVLKGNLSDWRFAGAATVADIGVDGYGLARISGPLELSQRKGGYALKANVAGAGGAGAGFAAATLGGAPTAAIEAERLANGQLLLRRLDVAGRGLKLQASGGRSLLSAVNVKAKAQVSNLAAARMGASGAAALDLTASQARANSPWAITLEARGERFALGIAELDRLLGASPRVQARADWSDGRLALGKASLDGAALDATAAGVMEKGGALAFKSDWSASGPFRAGPVEVTGKAKGTGGVTGTLSAPRLDLVAELEQIDVPRLPLRDARVVLSFLRQADGSSGAIALTATSTHGPARARSDFRFPTGGVDLTALSVDAGGFRAQGALSLRSRAPSSADLTVEVTPGAFLDAGRVAGTAKITAAGGAARATLDLQAQNVRPTGSPVTVRSARLTADGPLARLPYAVDARGASGQGAWTIKGSGVLNEAAAGYLLTLEGMGTLGTRDLHTVESAAFRFGGPETTARVRLAGSDGGKLDLDASLRGEVTDVRARVAAMGLNLFDSDFDGRIDANLVVQGRGARLDGTVDATLSDARGRGTPAAQGMDGTLRGRLADNAITLDLATTNEQGLKANANLVLPAEASARPFRVAIARQRPMRGRFFAEGEVRPLWELAIGGERALSGFVRTEGAIAGTLARPEASGQVSVERGRFDDGSSGLSLRDVALKAVFNEGSVNVTEARGTDGRGGSLSGLGRISLAPDGVSSFRLDLKGFRLIDNETATATATGQATINRAADGKVKLTGRPDHRPRRRGRRSAGAQRRCRHGREGE